MKKNIFLLSILTLMFSFFFSMPIIDNLSGSRVYSHLSAYDDKGFERVGIIIENSENLIEINNKEFYSKMNQIALSNNLVIYVLSTECSTDGSSEVCIFTSTNEFLFKDTVLLEKGYINEIREGVSYSTYSETKTNRILGFMPKTPLSIRSIYDYNEKGKYINVVSIKGDIVENVKNFMGDLANEYGDLIVRSPYTSSKLGSSAVDKEAVKGIYGQFNIKFAICLVLIVLLCAKIFSYTRKISIMKIEGSSAFNIYCKEFLFNYLKYTSFLYLVFTIFMFFNFGTNIMSLIIISTITLLELIQFLFISLFISMLLYLVIHYTPIMASVKGYNNLDEVQYLSYFIKFLVVFLIIPILPATIQSVAKLAKITIRHESVYSSLQNQYTFGIQGSSSKYMNDLGTENYISLRNDLAENGRLFEQGKAFFMPDNLSDFDPNNRDQYYSVDYFYLKKMGLDYSCKINEVCIFINEELDVGIEELKTKIDKLQRNPIKSKVIIMNETLNSYDINDLLYQDYLGILPLIYIPKEEGYDGQLNSTILLYEGSLEDVQTYVDSLFRKYNYVPLFNMSPRQIEYQRLYQAYQSLYINRLIQFIIMMAAYLFANRLLIEVDLDNNRKRYKISSFEGVNPYSVNIYLLKIVSPSIVAILCSIVTNRISMSQSLLYVSLIIILVELLLFISFIYKYSNVRRYK